MGAPRPLSSKDIVAYVLNGHLGGQQVHETIQKALHTFMETATEEIQTLVHNHVQGPHVRAEMTELHKSVIDITSRMIKDGPMGAQHRDGRGQGK